MSDTSRGYEECWPRGEYICEAVPDPANHRTLYLIDNGERREHSWLEQNALVNLQERMVNAHETLLAVWVWLSECVEADYLRDGPEMLDLVTDAIRANRGTLPPDEHEAAAADIPMLCGRMAAQVHSA